MSIIARLFGNAYESPVFKSYPLGLVRLALWGVALVFAVAILVLCICIAAKSKRGRALAVVMGIANFVFCLTVPQTAIQSALNNRVLVETLHYILGYTKAPPTEITPYMLLNMIVSFIGLFTFVVTLIFFIRTVKLKPRALGIAALVIFALRNLFIPAGPGVISGCILGFGSTLAQISKSEILMKMTNWITAPIDVLTAIFSLLVLTIAFALALIVTIKQNKTAKIEA